MAAVLVAISSGKLKVRSRRSFWLEAPVLIVVAFILALAIKAVAFAPFYIPSGSMQPTLAIGDRILVNKLSYRFHDPGRGDVVVFKQGDEGDQSFLQRMWNVVSEGLGRPPPNSRDLVKRVIGLPGDTVEVKADGVYVNSTKLNEPWLQSGISEGRTIDARIVPPGSYFVMGDNRANSQDSRYFGPVPKDEIVGRAIFKVWPPSRLGGI